MLIIVAALLGTKRSSCFFDSALRDELVRVVHIYKDYYPPTCGGIEIAINRLIEGTRDACDDIRVIISGRQMFTEPVEVEGTPVLRVGEWGRFLSAPVAPMFPYWLSRVEADILHYHIPNPTAVLSHLVARPRGKVIVHYHSDIVRQKRWLGVYGGFRHAFLRQADRIIVTSPTYMKTSDTLAPYQDKCSVIPFGVSPDAYQATPAVQAQAQTLRKRYGERMILFVGVLRYYKGLHVLLEAMRHVDGRLVIVGDGPLLPDLLRSIQALPYADRIILVGQVESVLPYYHAADMFCLPSIFRSEAFGLVLLEAAACGLPLVSTELGTGTSYINQHEETGLVVPPLSAEALAQALNGLLEDEPKRNQFGQAAQNRIHQHFTYEQMTRNVLELYHDVLAH